MLSTVESGKSPHELIDHLRALMHTGGGVPPDILAIREGGARDLPLMIEAHGAEARYRLKSKMQVPCDCIEEGYHPQFGGYESLFVIDPSWVDGGKQRHTVIRHRGIPNPEMIPANEAAERIFDAYIRSIHGDALPAIFTWESEGIRIAALTPEQHAPPLPMVSPRFRRLRAKFHGLVARANAERRRRAMYDHKVSQRQRAHRPQPPAYIRFALRFF